MNAVNMVLSKIVSGRFWAIILITGTACYMAIIEPSIRDAFFALAGGVIRDYFGRDRTNDIPANASPKPTV